MGKSKPRNRNRNRTNPAGKAVKPPADPELAAIREQRILPVLKDLQSADLKTRSTAASVITNIIEDTKCRKLLLREQIVRILFEQTLTDSSLETRAAGWGILRNLAVEEEADFCIHLYRQDVLTAIEGVVRSVSLLFLWIHPESNTQQIGQTIESQDPSFTKLPKAQQQLAWTLTGSIISLLSTLAEANDEIVEAITKLPTLITFLFGLLSFDSTPDELEIDVLSCLIALTEENKLFVQQIVDNEHWLKVLIQVKDSAEPKAVPACGVLHNVFTTMQWYDHNTPISGASDSMLVPVLVQSMETPKSNDANSHNGHSNPDRILQLALEITASIATSLQEALEHGSKHEEEFKGFDDDSFEAKNEDDDIEAKDRDAEDDEMEDDDQSMDSEEIDADMDLVLGDGPEENDEPAEEVTLDRLVRIAAPKLLHLARPSTSAEDPSVQSYVLSALNNIAWTVSSIDFSTGHLGSLQKFWSSLVQLIWKEIVSPVLSSSTADIELASSVTSLSWAVARSVEGVIKIQPGEQRKFMALYQASKGLNHPEDQNGLKNASEDQGDAFQGLGVKAIGVLGRLALDPAPVELNREIGVFLLTVLAALPDTPAADAVEALNQVFDIYADKSYAFDEAVFWADGFYSHLEEVLPKAKKMAKGIDKRKFGELRARADEAVLNLGRFLKYKRSEKSEGY